MMKIWKGQLSWQAGRGNAKTKLAIINGIETATGLGKHKIQVYEMKK